MTENRTLADLLLIAADKFPDNPAAVEGSKKLTYSELRAASFSLAGFLQKKGIDKGDCVALLLPNSIEYVTAIFGVALLGGVSVPINPAFTSEEVGFYVEHSGASVLLTDSGNGPLAEASTEGTATRVVLIKGESAEWDLDNDVTLADLALEIDAEDEAVYLYSTGSTGTPKRVARTHKNLVSLAENHTQTIGWSENERILFTIPLSHTYGFGNLLGSVKVGAAAYLVSGGGRARILDLIEQESITVFPAVPFMLGILAVTYMPRPRDFSSLRMVISAGSPLSEEVFYQFLEKFGMPPRQLYGSTETGVIAINMAGNIEAKLRSVGRPVENVEVRVVGEDGSYCEAGETGEIIVKSPSMVSGYFELPEETLAAFRDGYYYTGDIGRFDGDGYLFIEGRKKFVINVAGNKVDPLQVEEVLTRNPRVKEAVVLGSKDANGQECVRAVIVPDGKLSRFDVFEFLRGKLAEYKIPRIVEFRTSLPKSPTGKVLRNKL